MVKDCTEDGLREYRLVRVTDGVVVESFATEEEVAHYFMDERSPHRGENYVLKSPQIATTGYCQAL